MASNNQFNLVSTPVSSTSRFVGTPVSSSLSEQGKKSRGSQCCVPKCFNYMYNKDGSRSSQHFFRFPTEKDRKLKFCTLIKRVDGKDGFNVTDATRICSDHFNSSDFTGGMMKKKLKPEAEPSKFSWSVEREGRPHLDKTATFHRTQGKIWPIYLHRWELDISVITLLWVWIIVVKLLHLAIFICCYWLLSSPTHHCEISCKSPPSLLLRPTIIKATEEEVSRWSSTTTAFILQLVKEQEGWILQVRSIYSLYSITS